MTEYYVAYGSWKLRHNEPLLAGDRDIVLFKLKADIAIQRKSIVVKPGASFQVDEGVLLRPNGVISHLPKILCNEWYTKKIPLALLECKEDKYKITHGILRIELDVIQFMSASDHQSSVPESQLWKSIWDFYEKNHLFFSNHECFYIRSKSFMQFEHTIRLKVQQTYWEEVLELFAALEKGKIPGFSLKFTNEFEHWSYDNQSYKFSLDNSEQGFISLANYSRKKSQWDETLYTFKQTQYRDGVENEETCYENQQVTGDVQKMIEKLFGFPVAPLRDWRHNKAGINVESDNGNIFSIYVDDCRINDAEITESAHFCKIKYLHSRGIPHDFTIQNDFSLLVQWIETFFVERGTLERNMGSKLDFLTI